MDQRLLSSSRFFRRSRNFNLLKSSGMVYLHGAKKLSNMAQKKKERAKVLTAGRKLTEHDEKLNLLTDYIFQNLSKKKNLKHMQGVNSTKNGHPDIEKFNSAKKAENSLISKNENGRHCIIADAEKKADKQMSGNIMPPLIGSGPQILNITKAYILKLTNYTVIQDMMEKAERVCNKK